MGNTTSQINNDTNTTNINSSISDNFISKKKYSNSYNWIPSFNILVYNNTKNKINLDPNNIPNNLDTNIPDNLDYRGEIPEILITNQDNLQVINIVMVAIYYKLLKSDKLKAFPPSPYYIKNLFS